MKKKDIKSLIFVIWFIASFISFFILKPNTYLMLILFGQTFFGFGMFFVTEEDFHEKDSYMIFIFVLVGLAIMEIGIMGFINKEYVDIMIPYAIANAVTVFGFIIVLFEKNNIKYNKPYLFKFKTSCKGKMNMYQRSYRYNVKDLKLIRKKNKQSIKINKKIEEVKINNLAYKIGMFFLIFGLFLTIFIMLLTKM